MAYCAGLSFESEDECTKTDNAYKINSFCQITSSFPDASPYNITVAKGGALQLRDNVNLGTKSALNQLILESDNASHPNSVYLYAGSNLCVNNLTLGNNAQIVINYSKETALLNFNNITLVGCGQKLIVYVSPNTHKNVAIITHKAFGANFGGRLSFKFEHHL